MNIPEELIRASYHAHLVHNGWNMADAHESGFRAGAEWARKEGLREAASAIEGSTNPDGRYGSLNEGSRSQWFSKGIREASRRVWALLEGDNTNE